MTNAHPSDNNASHSNYQQRELRNRIAQLAKNWGHGRTIKLPNGRRVLILASGICQPIEGNRDSASDDAAHS